MPNYNIMKYLFGFILIPLICSASELQSTEIKILYDYEIEDVRHYSQDMEAYASFYANENLSKTCQDKLISDFKQKYYSPWTRRTHLSNLDESKGIIKACVLKEWYGENRRKVPKSNLDELLTNCNIDHLPSMKRLAITTVPTAMRVLPTTKPLFENADDFPFDTLQNTELKVNEPIRVLHVSRDGLWFFAETSDTNGWVAARDVSYIDKKSVNKWIDKAQLVIIKDATLIKDKNELVAQKVKLGTIFPISGEGKNTYEISVAVNTEKHKARWIKAKVPKESARRLPIEFSMGTVALIGNELLNKPYGWGEMYNDRDCSAMIRDFFMPFGIWLPRGSSNQIDSGKIISFAGLSTIEKEQIIKDKGIPFLTLIYLNGHIMLYVGSMYDKPLIFHSIWSVKINTGERSYRQVIGKSIISTLTPGHELNLVPGASLLERASKMLILTDRCSPVNP